MKGMKWNKCHIHLAYNYHRKWSSCKGESIMIICIAQETFKLFPAMAPCMPGCSYTTEINQQSKPFPRYRTFNFQDIVAQDHALLSNKICMSKDAIKVL